MTAIIIGPVFGSTISAHDPYFGIAVVTLIYMLAAFFNYHIPKLPIDHCMEQRSLGFLLKDFWHAFTTLWKDTQGQVSLAVTTLFWGRWRYFAICYFKLGASLLRV